MSKTTHFRNQHKDLLGIAGQIVALLNPATLSADAKPAASLFAKLMGTLKLHLAMEDESLYPRLIANKDPKVAKMAQAYKTEMVGVTGAVIAFNKKWATPTLIQADATTFCTETKALFGALQKRIDRENNELYPAADAA